MIPASAPAPPDGCKWKHVRDLKIGDLIYVGEHRMFGEKETFFHRVVKIEEKPKTYSVTLVPTHPRLVGKERRRFPRFEDEWVIVKEIA